MTELEMIQRAKIYMDKLANGINPLDDSIIPEHEIINQVRLSRCFFFVSDVLQRVIENGGTESQKHKKKIPFSLSQESHAAFDISDTPISVSEIAKRIDTLKNDQNMKRLKPTSITSWLVQMNLLEVIHISEHKTAKRPTPEGAASGILIEERSSSNGPYQIVLYNKNMQQFILDNLDAIIEMN